MGQILHGSATTTHAIRAATQRRHRDRESVDCWWPRMHDADRPRTSRQRPALRLPKSMAISVGKPRSEVVAHTPREPEIT